MLVVAYWQCMQQQSHFPLHPCDVSRGIAISLVVTYVSFFWVHSEVPFAKSGRKSAAAARHSSLQQSFQSPCYTDPTPSTLLLASSFTHRAYTVGPSLI